MTMPREPNRGDVDADGVRVFQSSGRRALSARLVLAIVATATLAVTVVSSVAVVWLRRGGTPAASSPPQPAAESKRVAGRPLIAVEPKTTPHPAVADGARPTRPNRRAPAAHPAPRPAPDAASEKGTPTHEQEQLESVAQDFVEGLRATGETKGIAAFPPPGTNPVKSGLVVPDDFELPKGYVRHYQTTDDGKRLEPILMFSPDYKFVDADGKPVEPPADGIVPPDMAPPGLPLRTLDVPKPARHAAGAGSNER
jgi:hypothetical protein